MSSNSTKVLSTILLAALIILIAADAVLLVSSPFWLSLLYSMSPEDLARGTDVIVDVMIPTGTYPFMQAFVALSGIALGGILFESIRLLTNVRKGNPFCMGNAKSLKRAAWFSLAQMAFFAAKMFNGPTVLTLGCAGIFLVAALLYLVLADLFRSAALLREDNDLTI